MSFDFDKAPDRRGSGSYKWDSAASADMIPLWVADMDFHVAPAITEALLRRVRHGVFGYVKVPDEYYDALTGWFARRHGWHINREDVIYTSGVVPALSAVIKALCRPGDGVIVQTPVYNCFFSSIRNNECRIVENPLVRVNSADGFTYRMDLEGLERLAADNANTMLLLCNPHNPAGRCWSAEELSAVAGICSRHGVTVVSDEIHCELTMPGYTYTPFARVCGDARTVVCNSPSKAFNTAGLQIANIVATNADMRAAIDRAININEVCDVNPFGVAALVASYTEGEPWLKALLEYLHGNYLLFRQFMHDELPQMPVARLEATYLAWIDISSTGKGGEAIEHELMERKQVWVNGGAMYGDDRFVRINLACPRERLKEGLRRVADGLKSL